MACVVGSVELVRALGAAGIRSAVVARPGAHVLLSRFTAEAVDPSGRGLVDVLVDYAGTRPSPLPLLYDSDAALLEISRGRDRLHDRFAFVMPGAELVEDLVDKARFQALSERIGLPVPRAEHVRPAESEPGDITVPFPLILKAVPFRDERWDRFGEAGKVLHVADAEELRRLWPRLAAAGLDLMAQEAVAGGEDEIVSYHVYVDSRGAIAGEFTGRKIRTFPLRYGMSSALVTTHDPDLLAAGRDVVERLDYRGPAKLDFKRVPGGRMALLEVNARFTLWAHPGAVAGVNLAALCYADLTGSPPPPVRPARAGVRWIQPRLDLAAARELGVPLPSWAWFALRCETNQILAWDDPGTLLRRLPGLVSTRARRVAGR